MAYPLNRRISEESAPYIAHEVAYKVAELSPCDLKTERNANHHGDNNEIIQSDMDSQKGKRKRKRNRKSKRSKQTAH